VGLFFWAEFWMSGAVLNARELCRKEAV